MRIDPLTSEAQVAARATALYRGFQRSLDAAGRDTSARVVLSSLNPMVGLEGMRPEATVSLWLMIVCVAVLLVACGNVANLLITRAIRRRRELAVRIALGADTMRLARLLLLDVVLIAVPATILGILATPVLADALSKLLLPGIPGRGAAFDWRVMMFTTAVGIACVVLVGLAPLQQASNPRIVDGLASSGSPPVQVGRSRNALVAFQAAFSVILLIGASLFIVSLRRVATRDLGIDVDRVVRVTIPLRTFGYDAREIEDVFREARERLLRVPGVVAVAPARYSVPLGISHMWTFSVPGADSSIARGFGSPLITVAGSEYLGVLGTSLLQSRSFTELEEREPTRAVVINELTARTYWPGRAALGECVLVESDSVCSRVIGVMESVIQTQLVGEKRLHVVAPPNHPGLPEARPSALLVRTVGSTNQLQAMRATVQGISPRLPFVRIEPYSELVAPQMRPWRLGATLFTVFGIIALTIAAVGMYCVLAYWVSQRTREIAVRVALGAGPGKVIGLVATQGMGAVVIGLIAGEILAFATYPSLSNLLFATSPRDPVIYAGVAAILIAAAIVAALVPARRAATVPAATALRVE